MSEFAIIKKEYLLEMVNVVESSVPTVPYNHVRGVLVKTLKDMEHNAKTLDIVPKMVPPDMRNPGG